MRMRIETRMRLKIKLTIDLLPHWNGAGPRVVQGRDGTSCALADRAGFLHSTGRCSRLATAPRCGYDPGSTPRIESVKDYFVAFLTDHSQKFQNGPFWLPMYFTPVTFVLTPKMPGSWKRGRP
jgi:hypothetical protein